MPPGVPGAWAGWPGCLLPGAGYSSFLPRVLGPLSTSNSRRWGAPSLTLVSKGPYCCFSGGRGGMVNHPEYLEGLPSLPRVFLHLRSPLPSSQKGPENPRGKSGGTQSTFPSKDWVGV